MAAEAVFASFFGLLSGMLTAGLGFNFLNLAIILFAAYLALFFFKRGLSKYLGLAALFCLAGNFYFHFYQNAASLGYPEFNSRVSVEAIVLTEPSFSGDTQTAQVKLLAPYAGKIKLITDSSKILRYGDKIKTEGTLISGSGTEIPFARVYSFELLAEGQGNGLKTKLLAVKESALSQIAGHLSPSASALMSGLILGERSNFSADFKTAMKESGTTHLVALSGYNIGIIVMAVGAMLGAYFSRKVKFTGIILCVILFVIMVGGEASVVRARQRRSGMER